MNPSLTRTACAALAVLVPFCLLVATFGLFVAPASLPRVIFDAQPGSFDELYVQLSLMPRALVALLAGAALALSGAVFQQVLKNPLAEPSTLGVMSGAQFAVTLASLSMAVMADWQREIFGVAGAFAALAIVLRLSRPGGYSPLTLLLAGMMTSFAVGSGSVVLSLFNHEYLRSAFIWASGSLVQNGYSNVQALALRLLLFAPILVLMIRPLTILALSDAQASSLGLSVNHFRILLLALATDLAASVTARVGVIAFVGLAAPNLAAQMGARTIGQRILWSPVVGAILLLATDCFVLILSRFIADVPTGSVSAVIGGVVMLVMLRRSSVVAPRTLNAASEVHTFRTTGYVGLPLLAVLLAVFLALSLIDTFQVGGLGVAEAIAGRWPRAIMALSAGAMLAMAGFITQATMANPLASPEGLGVTSGAALGIITAMFVWGFASPLMSLAGGTAGACLVLVVTLSIGRRHNYAPGQLLLSGVAIGALSTAVISVVIASGDPRAPYILAWTMGPTFRATPLTAIVAAILAGLSLMLAPLFFRALQILPLGDAVSHSIGLSPKRTRLFVLLFCAAIAAASTLLIGPLSFVGLMAPHIVRRSRVRGAGKRLLACAITGATIMVCADWIGRIIDFPYEIPAGVIAAIVGAPYFLWALMSEAGRK